MQYAPRNAHQQHKAVDEQRGYGNITYLRKDLIPRCLELDYGNPIRDICYNETAEQYLQLATLHFGRNNCILHIIRLFLIQLSYLQVTILHKIVMVL